jgi:hypothetical protein
MSEWELQTLISLVELAQLNATEAKNETIRCQDEKRRLQKENDRAIQEAHDAEEAKKAEKPNKAAGPKEAAAEKRARFQKAGEIQERVLELSRDKEDFFDFLGMEKETRSWALLAGEVFKVSGNARRAFDYLHVLKQTINEALAEISETPIDEDEMQDTVVTSLFQKLDALRSEVKTLKLELVYKFTREQKLIEEKQADAIYAYMKDDYGRESIQVVMGVLDPWLLDWDDTFLRFSAYDIVLKFLHDRIAHHKVTRDAFTTALTEAYTKYAAAKRAAAKRAADAAAVAQVQ